MPPPLSLGWDELHMDDIATNPVQTGGNTSPLGPDSQDSAAVHTLPLTYRSKCKICLIEEYMGWFKSLGNAPLETPPPCNSTVHGNIFIHTDGKNALQMWMRTTQKTWEPINAGHKHPYLPSYLFVIKKGRPSWVTQKTIATYTYQNIALAS
ncbi:hypothetical protein L208DRAFT_1381701 [Tricholoma matsutake]|nr:hypothetical protein L208DRAFT_1381701 [Tricholoma matsutake 945]